MSEGTKGQIQPPKKEDPKKVTSLKEDQTENAIFELKNMFAQFLVSSKETQANNRTDINELKDAIKAITRFSPQSPIGNRNHE